MPLWVTKELFCRDRCLTEDEFIGLLRSFRALALEQMRVHVERDRRFAVAELLAHVHHVFTLADLQASECVSEVMEMQTSQGPNSIMVLFFGRVPQWLEAGPQSPNICLSLKPSQCVASAQADIQTRSRNVECRNLYDSRDTFTTILLAAHDRWHMRRSPSQHL